MTGVCRFSDGQYVGIAQLAIELFEDFLGVLRACTLIVIFYIGIWALTTISPTKHKERSTSYAGYDKKT